MGKFSPDRTVLPIPDGNFGGTIGRTMDQSVADWPIVPGRKAPEGAPNVLICLLNHRLIIVAPSHSPDSRTNSCGSP